MKIFILKICSVLILLFFVISCNSSSDRDIDISLLTNNWICKEVFRNDELQEIFPGAYALELKQDKSYQYQAGMFQENGIWSVEDADIFLKNESGEIKEWFVLSINDTSLVVETEQMGDHLRMHFVPEN